MKNQFSTALFGYKKDDIDRYLQDIKNDYENELFKKKERLSELSDENRKLKIEIERLKKQIEDFSEQERCIAKALVIAEKNAQTIIEEGQQRIKQDMYVIKLEKEKWNQKFKQIRNDLIKFDNEILELMEKFHSDINYYTSKEISEVVLYDDDDDDITNNVKTDDVNADNEYNLDDVIEEIKNVIK